MTMQVIAWSGPSMGGRLDVCVATDPSDEEAARRAAQLVGRRVNAWASRLTRFSAASDLSRLNDDASAEVAVRPTLALVLDWAARAGERSAGVVDATLLDARLAAEGVAVADERAAAKPDRRGFDGPSRWRVHRDGRSSIVHRQPDVRFDLDGVAKGWLADRALALLYRWPGACVDADGDVALSLADGMEWEVTIADPRLPAGPPLAALRLTSGAWRSTLGVATSGTSVHRWRRDDGRELHHLIDPRTGRPAVTDVTQATVVAPTASEAEVLAKSAVILGSDGAAAHLASRPALAAVLLLESGEVLSLPKGESWLA